MKTVAVGRRRILVFGVVFASLMCGYFTKPTKGVKVIKASCSLKRLPVTGTIYFDQVVNNNETKIYGQLLGVYPGKHGFHIHEYGDVFASDCTSTGGHYNPYMQSHGAPSETVKHVGDLGNIESDATGRAEVYMKAEHIKLTGPISIIGRALVIHAEEDDLGLTLEDEGSLKTGNAGARLACCVIGYRK